MKLGPRRDLPAAGDLADLQAAFACFVFLLKLFDRRLDRVLVFVENFGKQLGRDRLVGDEDQRLDHGDKLAQCLT